MDLLKPMDDSTVIFIVTVPGAGKTRTVKEACRLQGKYHHRVTHYTPLLEILTSIKTSNSGKAPPDNQNPSQ
eukprot:m.46782 g.46782  ORF g.46782 m.46782 type:complete len:72 (+) comp10406_c0_seq1:367-582(+)